MSNFFYRNSRGSQKAIMIALLAAAIILIALVVVDMTRKTAPLGNLPVLTESTGSVPNTETPFNNEDVTNMTASEKNNFKADVPADTVVPELDAQLSDAQKKEIAVPTVVVQAAAGSSSKFRTFKISAENDTFLPTKVIANAGDTVHIDFTAVDKAYDIAFPGYNMKQSAQAGQTKILEFQALRVGDFTYYCPSCGGPDKGPTGHIIIVQ